ncbi:class I SAM-dependent methyltransferase [Laribacter hongkongensis]|uniref:class I SAM-dependent methyltransferase n=1 Tax=Laribacter hongkongensis TaxID=168471 RepID=UPI001D0C0783|nr:class I SAM-dependent methyltransferase [Laribacter hongkongensis]
MAQNIYDQQHFFDNYARLPRSVHGLSGAPEWAELRAMLPSLQGKDVVDLGCGYGWFCRYAVEHGAVSVSGLDLSRKMLERAQALTNSEAIMYQCCDLEQLSLPAQSFDLAYSSLALHYLRDINRFFDCLSQAVRPDGWLASGLYLPGEAGVGR